VRFPDYPELPGFNVDIIDIEIGPDIYAFMVNRKVDCNGAFFKAADTVEDRARPAEHGGAFEDDPVILFDELRRYSKIFDFPDLPCVKFHITFAVQYDEIVFLMGVHVPGTFYVPDRSRRRGFAYVNYAVDSADVRERLGRYIVEKNTGSAPEYVEGDDFVQTGDLFNYRCVVQHFTSLLLLIKPVQKLFLSVIPAVLKLALEGSNRGPDQ
jgi:hypothetical protein